MYLRLPFERMTAMATDWVASRLLRRILDNDRSLRRSDSALYRLCGVYSSECIGYIQYSAYWACTRV